MLTLEYNGQAINQREDKYVNATQMAKSNSVKVNDFLKTDATKAYIQELALITNIPAIEICRVKKGAPSTGGGTWMHPLLALNFGRWVSPSFAIWCDMHIKTLLETGETNMSNHAELLDKITKLEDSAEYMNLMLCEYEEENNEMKGMIQSSYDYVKAAQDDVAGLEIKWRTFDSYCIGLELSPKEVKVILQQEYLLPRDSRLAFPKHIEAGYLKVQEYPSLVEDTKYLLMISKLGEFWLNLILQEIGFISR